MILFLWTPPHFWSLAIVCRDDYVATGVPMLPAVKGVTRHSAGDLRARRGAGRPVVAAAVVGRRPGLCPWRCRRWRLVHRARLATAARAVCQHRAARVPRIAGSTLGAAPGRDARCGASLSSCALALAVLSPCRRRRVAGAAGQARAGGTHQSGGDRANGQRLAVHRPPGPAVARFRPARQAVGGELRLHRLLSGLSGDHAVPEARGAIGARCARRGPLPRRLGRFQPALRHARGAGGIRAPAGSRSRGLGLRRSAHRRCRCAAGRVRRDGRGHRGRASTT